MMIPTGIIPFALDSKLKQIHFHGMTLSVETSKGHIRYGKDWHHKMPADYGFINKTLGADGDEMDCYKGPHPESNKVFIVDQNRMDNPKEFDEHKVMLGYLTEKEAKADYLAGHTHGNKIFRGITETSIPGLKRWLRIGNVTRPVSKD